MKIYLVYDAVVGSEYLRGWFFTEWGARRFVKKYGDQFTIIKFIEKSGNRKVAKTQAYIRTLIRKNTGMRQEQSGGGYGV